MVKLNIKNDYTEYPGLRNSDISEKSGEDFYHDLLNEKFTEVYKANEMLEINLDDVAGYASSFLDESFGKLVYDFTLDEVKKRIIIISNDEPEWKQMIENKTYNEWEERRKRKQKVKTTKEHAPWFKLIEGKLEINDWSNNE